MVNTQRQDSTRDRRGTEGPRTAYDGTHTAAGAAEGEWQHHSEVRPQEQAERRQGEQRDGRRTGASR